MCSLSGEERCRLQKQSLRQPIILPQLSGQERHATGSTTSPTSRASLNQYRLNDTRSIRHSTNFLVEGMKFAKPNSNASLLWSGLINPDQDPLQTQPPLPHHLENRASSYAHRREWDGRKDELRNDSLHFEGPKNLRFMIMRSKKSYEIT